MAYDDARFDKGYSIWIRNISLSPSTAQLFIHDWCPNIFLYMMPTNTCSFPIQISFEIVAISALSPRILACVKRASITWASVRLKSVNFISLNNLDKL